MKTQQKYRNWLIAFTTTWFLVWTFLPIWLLKNDYIDILENLVWSRHFQFGYDKDPFLGAWITHLGYYLSGNHIWSAYILSQISVLICFWTIWRLGKKMLPVSYAFFAVLFLMGIQYYGQYSLEFNDDVIELALWALTCFYFYDAVKLQKVSAWMLTGLFAGLAFVDKYYGIMLFASMLVFLLVNKQSRKSWHKPGIYIAGSIFLLISLPNLIWLWQHDFIAITYALSRSRLTANTIINIHDHIISPLHYIKDMVFMVLPACVIFLLCFWHRKPDHKLTDKFNYQFITILCFGPLIGTLLFSLLTGGIIKSSWSTPIFSLLGIFVFMTWQPKITPKKIRYYCLLTLIMLLLWVCSYGWGLLVKHQLKNSGGYEFIPGKNIATVVTTMWHNKYHTPLKYVAAYRELACNVAIYSPDQPSAYFSWDTTLSPWINIEDLRKNGAVFLWLGDTQIPDNIAKRFPNAKIQSIPSFDWAIRNWVTRFTNLKKVTPIKVTIAFLPPKR